ncbi:hypothetical protein T484DRAFT_1756375 [Baffinella frigidus]|nr:hypothetical protein T484DRAFT_1756375 [Cryptophyta sp. CCMP2293]
MSTARATNAARAALPSTLLTARTFVVKAGIATPSLRTHPRHAATPSRTLLLSKRRAEPSVAARPAAWHGGGITTAGQQPLWRNQSGPAIMGGMIRNGVQNPENITVFDVSKEQANNPTSARELRY